MGIAIDDNGNVYTSNGADNSVTRISANGKQTSQFGSSTGAGPGGLAIDDNGNVYTANFDSNSVTRISADGSTTAQFGGTTGGAPVGIALDSAGNVYTANFGDNTVTRISADGSTTAPFGAGTGEQPLYIAIDRNDNIFTSNREANTVTRIGPDRTTLDVVGLAQSTRLAVDKRSVLVKKVRTDGRVTRARAWCELSGNRLPKRVQNRLCAITVSKPPVASAADSTGGSAAAVRKVRITAEPTCSAGLRIYATIAAKKPGARKATWTRTWRVDNSPRIKCRISGTG